MSSEIEKALAAYRNLILTDRTPVTDVLHDMASILYKLAADADCQTCAEPHPEGAVPLACASGDGE